MGRSVRYVRNMRGYGPNPPDAQWPGGANIAVSFVLNYEEGGENNILHGDAASEAFLSEIVGAAPWPGKRHWNMESIYEYGARVGFWRLHRLFTGSEVPITVYGVATALARSPDQVAAMQEADWEIASHGLRWIDYRDHDEIDERADLAEAIRLHKEVVGQRPTGLYLGRTSVNSVKLAAEEKGFAWISDAYDDELPYWLDHDGHGNPIDPQLVLPYTLDANDMRFATPQGFNSGEQFFSYLKDSFDVQYAEGAEGRPSMMTIGLHCRLIGRPGRFAALKRFVDYVRQHDKVWLARRIDIAEHWRATHPYQAPALRPSRMDRAEFAKHFGTLFGTSPAVVERACDLELGPAHDSRAGLHSALTRAFRSLTEAERLQILHSFHDALDVAEDADGAGSPGDVEREARAEFRLAYAQKFGFPLFATTDEEASALEALRRRLDNERTIEFEAACARLERIVGDRLCGILP